jgi:transcriptional regulator with XRE-family HTH domain
MSQGALAQAIGLTFQQVQKYEKGTNRISASVLVQLAHALNVPVRSFFDGLESGGDLPEAPLMQPSKLDVEILALLGQIEDGRTKRSVRMLLRTLAGKNDDDNDTGENGHRA